MKKLKLIFLIISTFVLFSCSRDNSLNIMTFNMKFENEDKPNKEKIHTFENRKKGIKKAFKDYGVDIIGSQELRQWQVKELMDILGERWDYFGVTRDGKKGETNILIYNTKKVKFIQGETIWLSQTPKIVASKFPSANKPRILTFAKFKHIKTNKEFYVFNTHLDDKSKEAREFGINIILNEIKKVENIPVILTGDFNMTIDDYEMKNFKNEKNLKDTFSQFEKDFEINGKTTHGFNGGTVGKPIDFIFYSKDKLKLLKTEIIRDKYKDKYFLSDHYPVYSKFAFI